MKEYFQLQYKMSNRKLTEFGIPPFLAYVLLSVLFVGLSVQLFAKTEFAGYVYVLIALFFLTKLTEKKRNEFLKSCFTLKYYLILRLWENLITILPFAIFLIYQKSLIFIPILLVIASTSIFFHLNTSFNFIIPTPFGKKPFEFIVGFRNTFFIFPVAYYLTYISISVGNFNLGIFSILLVFLVALSYYSKLENEYYIWSFSLPPKEFLAEKMKTGVFYTALICIPILIALGIFFRSELETLLIFLIVCYAYLATLILAKYSAYPNEMNIPQGVLIAISLIFPPMLIGIIPYFYIQSTKRLNAILQ